MNENQHNTELSVNLKNALCSGYYGHLYSADIHASTMVPRNTTEAMYRVFQSNEQQHKQLSDYMRSWLKK